MNESNSNIIKLRTDVEKYVLSKLKEIYWEFPGEICLSTTFKELEGCADSDLTDPGLLIYIEEDFGVEIPDEEAEKLDHQDVAALIDSIIRHLTKSN